MPTLSFKSKLRAKSESASLSLNVQHNIIAGQPSDKVHNIKPSLLAGLDILLPSNLLITISGRFNRSYIPPAVLAKSQIASHLVQYFNTNAENLCINAVSPACMVDSTGFTTITLSCSRPLSEPRLPISIALDRIHLFYDWQTNSASTIDDSLNPFSSSLPLPYLTLVEDVAQRFAASQLVRRYPIIFGNWSKQLHLEKKFAPSLWNSIHNIIENSPNEDFKESSRRTIARMRSRVMAAITESVSRLSEHVKKAGEDTTWTDIFMGHDKDAFGYCMHYLYCRNMRRPMFKSHTSGGQWSTTIEQTNLDLELGLALPHSTEVNINQSCDDIDLFDDDEMLYDSGETSLSMNGSGALDTGSIESSQATCYDLGCGPEEVGYGVVVSAALHANWSQDGRPSQKHLTHPVMGMDLDPTKGSVSSYDEEPAFLSAVPSASENFRDPTNTVCFPSQASPPFRDTNTSTILDDESTEECDTWALEDRLSGNTHDAGNIDLFDLVLQHEYGIGIIPFDRGGHGTNSMAGHPLSEDPTLSYFDELQNHSHASQSYQDDDNAPHCREISQTARRQSQALVEQDMDFSVMEF